METQKDFGRVVINRDANHPEAKNLPYPSRRVVGVLSSDGAVERAIARLRSEGFDEQEMMLFIGEEGRACLHNYHARTGVLGRLRQVAESLGTDPQQSQEYEEAVQQGRVVLAVKAPEEDVAPKIHAALAQENATLVRYYGQLAIRDLS
jgi:hypothetical protein